MTDTLPQRIEAAEGADRALDVEIAALLCGGTTDFDGRYWKPGVRGFCVAPRYTASIDAALTLADKETDPLDILEQALASCRDARDGVVFLPLHICAAALRAKDQTHD